MQKINISKHWSDRFLTSCTVSGLACATTAHQSIYISHAVKNSASAAISSAILAMIVVYLFLGNLRRTLIIGSAIPIANMVTFFFMGLGMLSLNIMTLG
jgi:multidrug efflux pump subunit AcrB